MQPTLSDMSLPTGELREQGKEMLEGLGIQAMEASAKVMTYSG